MKEEILRIVRDNQVVVISGETGCGKTTQVCSFNEHVHIILVLPQFNDLEFLLHVCLNQIGSTM